MLRVKLMTDTAKIPTVGNPGEDLGYDLYADFRQAGAEMAEAGYGAVIAPKGNLSVTTGISVEFKPKAGGIMMTRSSMAKKRVIVVGGVIDAGYRGELVVMLENLGDEPYTVKHGDKIAQLIQNPHLAMEAQPVAALDISGRMAKGFGSTGK